MPSDRDICERIQEQQEDPQYDADKSADEPEQEDDMFSIGQTVRCIKGGCGPIRGREYTICEVNGLYVKVVEISGWLYATRFTLVVTDPDNIAEVAEMHRQF